MTDDHSKAVKLLMGGDAPRARDILEQFDRSPEVLNDLAAALHQLGDTKKAVELLDEALDKRPNLMPAFINRRYMRFALDAPIHPPRAHTVVEDWGPPPCPSPKVSVVIPTYDRPDFLERAARSVLDQTWKDLELIVVSDGGPPDSGQILKKIGSERVRHIVIEHGGISAALNTGVVRARGEYVAYLDDDDIYLPDHVESLAGYMETRPEVQTAYTFSWRCLQKQNENGWETYKKSIFYPGPFDRERLKKGNIIETTGSIMHRRKFMDEAGGFNEGIIGCQDWEFYLRISEKRVPSLVPRVTLEHYIRERPGSQLSGNPRVMRRSDMTVTYMHRLVFIPSHVPGRVGYRRAMRYFKRIVDKWPDVIDVVDLKEMMRRKSYAFLYRIGRDLAKLGETDKARAAFRAALKTAPWELKTWGKAIKP